MPVKIPKRARTKKSFFKNNDHLVFLTLDELTAINIEIRQTLTRQMGLCGCKTKQEFIDHYDVDESLYYLDMTIKCAKSLHAVDLLPFQ